MWYPRSTFIRLFVDDNSCSGWCEWCTAVVELTIKEIVAGEFGIDTGRSKEIEVEFSLW